MVKKIVEDVLPPRRSIRNIPLSDEKIAKENPKPRARRSGASSAVLAKEKIEIDNVTERVTSKNSVAENHTETAPSGPAVVGVASNNGNRGNNNSNDDHSFEEENFGGKKRHGWRRVFIWGVAVASLVFLVYISSFAFVKATVKIIPKQWVAPVEISLEASKNGEKLSYNLVTISSEAGREVKATGEEQVETKASGEIVIFNNHSSSSQTLIKNTRFQNSDGLIFRIKDAVTVPGTTTKGGTTTPGSLKVMVFAEEPGEKYNVGLEDFIIPGFAGDPRQKTITAKSDPASPIGGGFVGKTKVAEKADIDSANASIEEEIRTKLQARAISETPKDQVFFPTSSIVTFENVSDNSGGSSLTVKKRGTLTGALFNKKELSSLLNGFLPEEAKSLPNNITKWSDVNFILEEDSKANLTSGELIKFNLEGNITAIASIDPSHISSSLAGKKRSNFSQIMSEIRSVAKAELQTHPSWSRSLPRSTDKIKVEIEPNE